MALPLNHTSQETFIKPVICVTTNSDKSLEHHSPIYLGIDIAFGQLGYLETVPNLTHRFPLGS